MLENELDKTEDKEYCDEIEGFLNSKNNIYYSYTYPWDSEDVSHQVNHFAPINENGHKPIYINMWSKLSESWDVDEIKKSVRILMKEFLHIEIKDVEMLEAPTYQETKESFQKDYEPFIKS